MQLERQSSAFRRSRAVQTYLEPLHKTGRKSKPRIPHCYTRCLIRRSDMAYDSPGQALFIVPEERTSRRAGTRSINNNIEEVSFDLQRSTFFPVALKKEPPISFSTSTSTGTSTISSSYHPLLLWPRVFITFAFVTSFGNSILHLNPTQLPPLLLECFGAAAVEAASHFPARRLFSRVNLQHQLLVMASILA